MEERGGQFREGTYGPKRLLYIETCTRTWAVPAMWNSSYELNENNTIKNPTQNVQPVNINKKKKKNYKKSSVITSHHSRVAHFLVAVFTGVLLRRRCR